MNIGLSLALGGFGAYCTAAMFALRHWCGR